MAVKQIAWADGSGDVITVTYDGTPGTTSMSITSEMNKGTSSRTKVLTISTIPSGVSKTVTVTQNKPVELRAIQYGTAIPASFGFHGTTVTNTGTTVSLDIPGESPHGSVIHVTKLTLTVVNNRWYISATAGQAGTFYIVDQGSSYFMVSSVDSGATIIQDIVSPWSAGDKIYNRRASTKGIYVLNDYRTQLTLEGQPSTDNLYRDITANKLYEYNGSDMVEITE